MAKKIKNTAKDVVTISGIFAIAVTFILAPALSFA